MMSDILSLDVLQRWIERCAVDPALASLGAGSDVSFCLRSGSAVAWLDVRGGQIVEWDTRPTFNRSWDFTLSAPPDVWEHFLQPVPQPTFHDLFAMLARVPAFQIEGQRESFAQHAHVIRRLLELWRLSVNELPEPDPIVPMRRGIEPIIGRYVHLDVLGTICRVYFEESGAGRDLLLLHTAGSDARQFHHLLNHPSLMDDWRMVAFDLPLHGKSLPPAGYIPGSYRLTTEFYATTIYRLVEALGLDQPVVLGCSMGGEICLELAYRYPDTIRAVIACEASAHIEGRQVGWAKHPRVNASTFVPEWVTALMAPQSPAAYRDEVWWEYSQGGYGVFYGDIDFYSREWDARERIGQIDTTRCPVYLLTGEYDFSCTPEHSRQTAEQIPGARFQVMAGLGHFPMAEHPERFLGYLLPILDEVRGVPSG